MPVTTRSTGRKAAASPYEAPTVATTVASTPLVTLSPLSPITNPAPTVPPITTVASTSVTDIPTITTGATTTSSVATVVGQSRRSQQDENQDRQSKASSKKNKQRRLAKLKIDLITAQIAALEAESSDDDEDCESILSGPSNEKGVASWVDATLPQHTQYKPTHSMTQLVGDAAIQLSLPAGAQSRAQIVQPPPQMPTTLTEPSYGATLHKLPDGASARWEMNVTSSEAHQQITPATTTMSWRPNRSTLEPPVTNAVSWSQNMSSWQSNPLPATASLTTTTASWQLNSSPMTGLPPTITTSWQPYSALMAGRPATTAVSWQLCPPLMTAPTATVPCSTPSQSTENINSWAPIGNKTSPHLSQKTDIQELASAITSAVRAAQHQSPRCTELPIFNGAHQDWLTYRAAYNESAPNLSPLENMARLRRSLRGVAKEAVHGLLIANADPSNVMRTLETRFGRPDSIAMAEIERLRSLPRLTESPREVCTFATKVENIVSTLQALNCTYYLYNPEVTKGMVEKLTPTLRRQWYEFASVQPRQEPDLLKFSRFIRKEADICSPFAPSEAIAPNDPSTQSRHQQRVHTLQEDKLKCPLCHKVGHPVTDCNKMKDSSISTRWDLAKKHRLCYRCLRYRKHKHSCKPKKCGIDACEYYHHKLLHNETSSQKQKTEEQQKVNSAWSPQVAYLKIAPVRISGPAGEVDTFALLDDGSTVTLVDADLAKKIGATGPCEPLSVSAFDGETTRHKKSHRVKFIAQGTNSKKEEIEARTIENLDISAQKLSDEVLQSCKHLSDIPNQAKYSNAKPKILIGQDNWHLLLATDTRIGKRNQPVASLTPLGWVLHGGYTRAIGHRINFVRHQEDKELEELVRDHLTLDNIYLEPKKPNNDPGEKALKTLRKFTTQTEGGRYQTSLIWKNDNIVMPDNYENTLKRLYNVEKRLDRDPLLKKRYNEEMNALLIKGYAEPAPPTSSTKTWFLPHFAVFNPMKPEKLRIVHDAAAKTKGISLNDQLLTGPDLLQPLPGVIMKFRQHRIAVTADITEMFLQIELRPEDRDALRYLWRGDRRDDQPPDQYRMKSLIFGATSSPATAIYVKNENAEKFRKIHPTAVEAIHKKHYMDDYLDSFESEETAIEIATAVRKIHRNAHFELKKWASNSPKVLEALGELNHAETVNLKDELKIERVLGLIWKPAEDQIAFNLNLARIPASLLEKDTPTKRQALRIVMSLFDPLGIASPVTIKAKQILQEVWRNGTGWDDPIDGGISATWMKWICHLKNLRTISIPRAYPGFSSSKSLQLHVFMDASESAYATVLYWRMVSENGTITVSIITAKAKVAPLKVISIPRMELQAAVLGARMATAVKEEHEKKPESTTFWTDSRTTLSWIRTGSRAYKPYVAHRVAAIEEHSTTKEWRWIPTKLNVADDATRDVPDNFNCNHRWFLGPEFLYQDSSTWPNEENSSVLNTGEERTFTIASKNCPDTREVVPNVERFSKWERYLRSTARVVQFINLCRRPLNSVNYKRMQRKKKKDPNWGKSVVKAIPPQKKIPTFVKTQLISLSANDYKFAENLIFRASQEESFQEELTAMRKGKQLPCHSRLQKISVELSKDGMIQLKSRIRIATDIPQELKNLPVLDGEHRAVRLWIEYIHELTHHAGVEATLNECRQLKWVIRLRPIVRQIIHRCLRCRMRTARPPQPSTGELPPCRLAHHQRPFTFTGIDYFGPLMVTVGRTHQKRYVALFTCLTTRAIHLELVHSLSTDSAIMALRRFIARRGSPTEIWSDNGTNFRGAAKEIRNALQNPVQEEAGRRYINWRFIPPGAPFMGGCWERLVRSVKIALTATLTDRYPKEEVLETVLLEAELTVNSRPLTHVSLSPEDPEALTPNHFLLGGSSRVPTSGQFSEQDINLKSSWKTSQALAEMFWKRWLREYLPELHNRRNPHSTGPEVKIGDLVQIVDGNNPRNTWIRGRIESTFPGPDGIVRTVDVRTKGGILRRPVKKIVILPVEDLQRPAPLVNTSLLEETSDARRE